MIDTEIELLEEIGVLYRGLILGLLIAAPVGPVGLLCIRRTLQKGTLIGLATGLGAACTDALFGSIAVYSVSAILGFIHHYEASIRIIGGFIVFAAAWHTWFDHPKPAHQPEFVTKVIHMTPDDEEESIAKAKTRWIAMIRAGLTGLIITMTNPLTLFATLAFVATFGAVKGKLEANVLILGIFCGSTLWWFMLTGGVSLLRRHFTENRIVTVNRLTAIGLAALGAWALASGIGGYLRLA
ncbi:MAG: LysE family transporter [Alphaproteobacteria bacterium]|nr:LysE family transporter [Alphaproteobacteria bacterium]